MATKARASSKRAASTKTSTPLSVTRTNAKQSAGKKAKYPDIRRDLERQRAAILDEVGDALTNRSGQETFPDVSDQASAEVDQNFSMRIREREQKLLKKIEEALERMKSNTYGICERCGTSASRPVQSPPSVSSARPSKNRKNEPAGNPRFGQKCKATPPIKCPVAMV
jgi:DnaK suppressor protein